MMKKGMEDKLAGCDVIERGMRRRVRLMLDFSSTPIPHLHDTPCIPVSTSRNIFQEKNCYVLIKLDCIKIP